MYYGVFGIFWNVETDCILVLLVGTFVRCSMNSSDGNIDEVVDYKLELILVLV